LVLNTVAVVAEVVISPPLTAKSPVSVVSPVTANVPPTVVLPSISTNALRIFVVPVVAPIVSEVAAPAKFTVVAVVLYKSCVALVPTTVGLLIVNVPVAAPKSIAVALPNAFTVVAVVSNRLNVVAVVVISPPLTAKSSVTAYVPPIVALPSTSSNALRTVSVPVVAPMVSVVAAPNALTVVAVVSAKLNVVLVTTKFSPSIETLPSTSKLLLIFVVPVAAPNSKVVAAVNAFTVAAFAVSRLNVVAVVVKSPPLIATSPLAIKFPVLKSPSVDKLPKTPEYSTFKLPTLTLA
jgi:hypothetical protein